MTIGSTVETKLGPMRVLETYRYTTSAYVRVVLVDGDDMQWIARIRPGRKVNRTNSLTPNM